MAYASERGFSENVTNVLFPFIYVGTFSWTPDLWNLEVETEMVSEIGLERVGGFSENITNVLFPFFFVGTLSWTPDLEIGVEYWKG